MNNFDLVVYSNLGIGTIRGKSNIDFAQSTVINSLAPKTAQQPIEALTNNIFDFASWGPGNNLPDKYQELINKNSTLSGSIEKKLDKLFAGGIEYGILDENRQFQPKYIPEVEAFLEQPTVMQYQASAWENYLKFGNPFPKLCFSADKRKLLNFTNVPAKELRFAYQNPKTGVIEKAFWSKDWALAPGRSQSINLPVVDELYHDENYIRNNTTDFYYIMKISLLGNNTYYQLPPWYSVVEHGWYDHSNQVPKWYRDLMDNITALQFEIIFNEDYFKNLYGDKWENGTVEQKLAMMNERLAYVEGQIKKPGASIAKTKFWDHRTGQYAEAWEIRELKSETYSGEFLKNLQEADQHIMWAVGLDPIELGKQGDNSGSGKKAAFNGDMSTNERHATAILAPFYFWKRYNKLNPALKFRIKVPYLADLNQITPDKRNSQYSDSNFSHANNN